MLTVGSGALVVMPMVVDMEATVGEAGSGVVFKRVGVGLCAVSSTVRGVGVGAWMVRPCVDSLSAWGLEGVRLAVGPGRPCEPAGPLTFVGVPAAGWALVAGVRVVGGMAVVGLDDVPLPGARVPGTDGVLQADAGVGGTGGLEAAPARVPPAVAEVPTSVLCVAPAVTAREVWSPPQVPLVSVTGDGVAGVILSAVVFKTSVAVSTDEFFSKWSHVWLRSECLDVCRLSDKDQEETQTSTRAVHILQVGWERGWVVPKAPSWPRLRLLRAPCCLAEVQEAAVQGALPSWAIFLGELRAWH